MRAVLLVLGILFTLNLGAKNKISNSEKEKITNLFNQQVKAWNDGDIEKFMETYLKSDELIFVGSHGPTYGWQATLDNYKKHYPDKATMGTLGFKILKIDKIDRKTVFVIGRFEVTRTMGNIAGHFTLVIQKFGNKWLIVSDHSSAGD